MSMAAALLLAASFARAQSIPRLELPRPPQAEPVRVEPELVPLKEGDPAPNFGLKELDGGSVELAELRGKVVLVEFWASWCGPCKQSMPKLVELYKQYKDKGLVVLSISMDNDEEDLRAYLKENPVPFKVLFEPANAPAVAQSYAVRTIPRSFVVGKDGRLVLADGSPKREVELAQAIEKALLAP